MHIGILTGGGDCPGLNAVIRAVARSLIQLDGTEVIGIEQGFLGLIERRVRPLDLDSVADIMATGGTILGTHNKANPFGYFGAGGADVSEATCAYVRELGLDAIVVIGGDGSMAIAHQLAAKGIPVVGVPEDHRQRPVRTPTAASASTAPWRWWPRRWTGCRPPPQPRPRDDRSRPWAAMPAGSRWKGHGRRCRRHPACPNCPTGSRRWRSTAASARHASRATP
jgi:hypothetical protein